MDQLGLTITASAKTLQQGDDGSKLVYGFEPLREDVSRKALSGLLVAAAAEVAAAAPLEKEREGGREGRRERQRIKRMESRCREPERRQSLVYDPYIRIPSDLFGERQNRPAPAVHLPMPSSGRSAGIYPPPRPLPHPQPWTLQAGRRETPWAVRSSSGECSDYLPSERVYRRQLLNFVPSRSLGAFDGRRRRRRWGGYRGAGVWQQQRSVPHHCSLPSLACPLVKRRNGRGTM